LLRHYLDKGAAPPAFVKSLSVSDVYQFALLDDSNRDEPFAGDVALFRATTTSVTQDDEPYIERYSDPMFGWQKRITGTVHCFDVPGGHFTMLQEPHAQTMAQRMQAYIDRTLGESLATPSGDARPDAEGSSAVLADRPVRVA